MVEMVEMVEIVEMVEMMVIAGSVLITISMKAYQSDAKCIIEYCYS